MSIQTNNPSTNKTEKSFGEMTEKALDEAVAQSASAYNYWKKISYKERSDLLHKVAFLMREKRWALAKTITMEMEQAHW